MSRTRLSPQSPSEPARQASPRARLPAVQRVSVARIEGVRTYRCEVCPEDASHPQSFAVDPGVTVAWSSPGRVKLPLSLTWSREAESRWVLSLPLGPAARCFGLGERYGGLNLRGRVHTLLNTDDHHHVESTDRLYKAIPFLLLGQPGKAMGLFLDSPAPQRWNLDRELDGNIRVELLSRRGWQLYVFGPAPLPALVAAFTRLTGRSDLPPLWSLGHQQSRWSYPTERAVREIAAQFRARKIPCDTVVLDIDYMDSYRVFTVSRERFPHFEDMVQELGNDGFHLVTIFDPGVAKSEQDATFREGQRGQMFCRTRDGTPYVDEVWPGPACFPDFLRPEVRDWWGEKLRILLSRGVAGIWNDMNEPSFFQHRHVLDPAATELPDSADQLFLQQTPEGLVGHLEVRNAYGSQMARSAMEALRRERPDERFFVLTRSCYAGMQRFGAVWLGDNKSWFEHLRMSIPMLLNIGLSGLPFCGVDIGGFNDDADGELLVRWYELGIFYPFFRNHCAQGHLPQEPWAFGARVERWVRRLIEIRYQLLPYIQRLFVEHREQGAPLMRPLFWHYPEDPTASEIDDQFLFGKDLLVAPIVARGHQSRPVYLPEGRWYPFDGGPPLRGGRWHSVDCPYGKVPAFAREGAILPLADVVQHTGELPGAAITFRCYGSRCQGRYYQDDGATFAYERGHYDDWELDLVRGRFTARPRHLGFDAPSRRYYWEAGGKRTRVKLEGGGRGG